MFENGMELTEQEILKDKLQDALNQKLLLEDALAQAQCTNIAKTRFLTGMSHDIRTPINSIIGLAAIAAKHIDDKEKVKDCLDKILMSGNYLLNLIDDILDISRIESGKDHITESECNIAQLVHTLTNIIQPQVKAKNLDFSVDIIDVVNEEIYTDFLKLNQVLLNILSNAVKFTPTGGKVSFRVRQRASVVPNYGDYEFSIKDTGIGMPPEVMEHIFEPFLRGEDALQNQIQGTGLGMSIAKGIMDMLGGTIEVRSTQGKGSEFIICLHLKLQETSSANSWNREKSVSHCTEDDVKGKRVLVVEDNELNREIAEEMLIEKGLCVEFACDGAEAVERMRVSDENYYDAVLMDVKMPVMNGYEATRRIRNLPRKDTKLVPIIAMTADASHEDREQAIKNGMTAQVSKPLHTGILFDTISGYLRK